MVKADESLYDDFSDDGDTPRYVNAERIVRLLYMLSANNCTREHIFERMKDFYSISDESSSSRRTSLRSAAHKLNRDLRFLKNSMGYEIQEERIAGREMRYSLTKGSSPFMPFLFNAAELDTLALLHTLFADPTKYTPSGMQQSLPVQTPHTPFGEAIVALVERLTQALPTEQQKYFERWTKKPFIYFNLDSVTDYLPYRDVIDTIIRAITQGQQIRFDYTSMQLIEPTPPRPHEHVDPYYIIYQDGHLYLIGFRHAPHNPHTSGIFEWRIDRIQKESIRIKNDPVAPMRRRPLIEFRYWADASIAKGSLSQRWVAQTIEREEVIGEGRQRKRRLLIRAQAYGEWRIIQQLHKYADKIELIEPPYLRERMRQEVKRMYEMYYNSGQDTP